MGRCGRDSTKVPQDDERRSRPLWLEAPLWLHSVSVLAQVLEQVLKETKKDGKSVGFLWSQGGDQFEMEEVRDADSHDSHTASVGCVISGAGFAVWLPGGRSDAQTVATVCCSMAAWQHVPGDGRQLWQGPGESAASSMSMHVTACHGLRLSSQGRFGVLRSQQSRRAQESRRRAAGEPQKSRR